METALLESTPLDEASFPSRFKTQGTAGSHGIFTHRSGTTLRPILPSCLKCQLSSRPWGTLLLSPKVTLGNPGVSPFSQLLCQPYDSALFWAVPSQSLQPFAG